jgi:hypothetical protein
MPEGVEEDRLWGEAITRFPFVSLPDLLPHPDGGPSLYILDQNSRGLIPGALLQNLKGAVIESQGRCCRIPRTQLQS